MNREHDVLVFPVVRVDVMGVVSGDEAQVVFFPKLEEGFVEFLNFRDVVLLELEEEAVAAEAFKIPFDFGAGVGEIAAFDRARYFRRHAAGGTDQAVGVFFERFMIDPRVIVEAVELRDGRKLEQVLIALLIFGEEEEMARSFVVGGFVGEFLSGKVGFDADDGFYAFGFCGFVELDDAEHGAVVGDGDGGHVHFFDAVHEFVNLGKPVE